MVHRSRLARHSRSSQVEDGRDNYGRCVFSFALSEHNSRAVLGQTAVASKQSDHNTNSGNRTDILPHAFSKQPAETMAIPKSRLNRVINVAECRSP